MTCFDGVEDEGPVKIVPETPRATASKPEPPGLKDFSYGETMHKELLNLVAVNAEIAKRISSGPNNCLTNDLPKLAECLERNVRTIDRIGKALHYYLHPEKETTDDTETVPAAEAEAE